VSPMSPAPERSSLAAAGPVSLIERLAEYGVAGTVTAIAFSGAAFLTWFLVKEAAKARATDIAWHREQAAREHEAHLHAFKEQREVFLAAFAGRLDDLRERLERIEHAVGARHHGDRGGSEP
jgi:hypothetical protein